MKAKETRKRLFVVFSLLVLSVSGLCCIGVLKSSERNAEPPPWSTTITVYNHTDKSFCRVWLDQPTVDPLSYVLTKDQLGFFESLDPGKNLTIEDAYFKFGVYDLWLLECGTTLWNHAASIGVSGEVCGSETTIHVGEPVGPSATQTAMAYSPEPAPTPLVTPQFSGQSGDLSGVYFFGSEDSQWTESIPGGKTHYIHTLLRFYEDGLVIATYLEFDEV